MYAQGSKRLGSPLAKANVTQLCGFSNLENVIYGIWNVVPREIIDANNGVVQRWSDV